MTAALREPAAWLRRADGDRRLGAIGRGAAFAFVLRSGADALWLRVEDGRVVEHATGYDVDRDAAFALRADPETWAQLLAERPPPGRQSVFALRLTAPDFAIDGSHAAFARHAHVVARLLELARPGPAGEPPRPDPAPLAGVRGRYVEIDTPDGPATVLVEESGAGPDVLFLHTAGADARQWHGVLADPELCDAWHLVAFDLPAHGRSTPPRDLLPGEWRLDTERYVAIVRAAWQAAGLERPVLVGCSIGGSICLELALRFGSELRGVIAMQAAAHVPGRRVTWARHAAVNETLFVPEWTGGMMAPGAPGRDAARWHYAQAAHGIYWGDISLYADDWDARERIGRIDTRACPVHLMSGEYDPSCPPAVSRATAEAIPGATFEALPELGHFPMVEDPQRLLGHLRPALARLRS